MKKSSKQKKNGNAKKPERHSRIDSAVQALKTGPMASKEEWIKQADKLYVKHGGASNISESGWAIRHSYAVLKVLGCMEEKEDGSFSLKK
jgi:hypothetical protein